MLHDSIPRVIAVNSVAWAPHEYGLVLCCGSSDGSVSILTSVGSGHWDAKKIVSAHTVRNSQFLFLCISLIVKLLDWLQCCELVACHHPKCPFRQQQC
jgi:hypothetical protein